MNRESEQQIGELSTKPYSSERAYPETHRVKKVLFSQEISATHAMTELERSCRWAGHLYQDPLVQVRFILPLSEEEQLLDTATAFHAFGNTARVNGRIPFQGRGREVALYYIQSESLDRPSYIPVSQTSHEEALEKGRIIRNRSIPTLPEGFEIAVIEFINGHARDILHDQPYENLCQEELAIQLALAHRDSFQYPHDFAQQTEEGVMEILNANPVIFAIDRNENAIASVGYLEADPNFSYSDITLIEPTYFTRPRYEGKGLSSLLRKATQNLVNHSQDIIRYNGAPLLVFNESVRTTSFPLSFGNGCELAGTADLRISGNLGDAYTAIGPANPDVGFMPMGLTYFADPRIALPLTDNFR